MGRKRQQGTLDQLDLFEVRRADVRHGATGESGTGSGALEESQASTAWDQQRALTTALMEEVANPSNLNQAYKRVKANKGAAGIDGMTVDDLLAWVRANRERLIDALIDGSYQPNTVRGVELPKPGGGMRQLGIPTVVDRLVQQAILQVLEPILDPAFSTSSFGFRPGRSAHQALAQARAYIADGRNIVVDIDLEKFFDRVNHDVLMARLAQRIGDKRLLRIVRRFLEAGMMQGGVCIKRHEGTPQGGPLSPLLANLLLDDLDKELERRGHAFCRYADDCNIYVRSEAAGQRVMASIVAFLTGRLHLKVNIEKSAVAPIGERSFLGHRLLPGGRLGLAPKSLSRAKERLRHITRRNRGIALEQMIAEVNGFTTGWVTYFRHAACKMALEELDTWLRRKLRCVRLKQLKRTKAIVVFLTGHGVAVRPAWRVALSGNGWWRLSDTQAFRSAMSLQWFLDHGLINLSGHHAKLQPAGNRRVR